MQYCFSCKNQINVTADGRCPLCGSDVTQRQSISNRSEQTPAGQTGQYYANYPQYAQPTKPKHSVMGVLALIFSLTFILSIVGLILGIIDLTKNDGRKRTLPIIAIIISSIFILIIGGALGGDRSKNTSTTSVVSEESMEEIPPVTEQPESVSVVNDSVQEIIAIPSTETKSDNVLNGATTSQIQAYKKAQSYLNYSAFSYSGLVDQLEYEGFSTEDATYAADNCGADWNEQALKKGKSYLDFSAFSHDGLIEQLEYEGWAYSELDSNIVRSVLAEYIVATALEITDLPGEDFRQMWRPYDLMFEGKRIEIKSASTIQTWNTRNKGNFTFSIAPARVPNENGDYKEDAPLKRNSDIYVFCIFDPESEDISPLNLDAWTFYIVPTRVFDEKMPAQKTISFNPLMKMAPVKCSYGELREAVRQVLG